MIKKKTTANSVNIFGRTDPDLAFNSLGSQDDVTAANSLAYSKKLPKPNLVYVVDFFCGCGGMSWGFSNTRQSHFAYRILGGIDINEVALATYAKNIGAPAFRLDIRSLAADPKSLSDALGVGTIEALRPLVFVGCPPCQGFSAHRKKDDRDDPRNDLAVAFATLCDYFQPDVIVMENVPEILKGRFANYFSHASKIIEKSGYILTKEILDLSRYGVPQKRMRAVVLGARGRTITMPQSVLPVDNPVTVRQAIGHLSPFDAGECDERDPFHRAPAHIDRILRLIKLIPKDGGDRRSLPSKIQLRCHSEVDKGTTPGFTDVYGRLRWDTPAVTITAKSSTPSCGRFLHPEQNRNITVREAAILQGFPQEYSFQGPFINQYRQIGEAVPPVFSRSIAWHILDYFNNPEKNEQPIPARKLQTRGAGDSRSVGMVDAFCGAGGLSLGFGAAGFHSLYAFDCDASAVDSFNSNLEQVAEVADVNNPSVISRIGKIVHDKNLQLVLLRPA